RDNRRGRVNHQLPSVGKVKNGTGRRPNKDNGDGNSERPMSSHALRRDARYSSKSFLGSANFRVFHALTYWPSSASPTLNRLSGPSRPLQQKASGLIP